MAEKSFQGCSGCVTSLLTSNPPDPEADAWLGSHRSASLSYALTVYSSLNHCQPWRTSLFQSARATTTKYRSLGHVSSRHLFFHSNEGYKSKIKVPTGLISPEATLLVLQRATPFLPLHRAAFLRTHIPGVDLLMRMPITLARDSTLIDSFSLS